MQRHPRPLHSRPARWRTTPTHSRAPVFGIAGFGVLALVIHAVLLFLLTLIPKSEKSEPEATRVTYLQSSNASSTNAAPIPPKPKLLAEKTEPPKDGQLVTLPNSNDPPPDKADYLARANQKTERETRARVTDPLFTNPGRKTGKKKLDSNRAKSQSASPDEGKRGKEKSAPAKPILKAQNATRELQAKESETGTLQNRKEQSAVKGEAPSPELAMGPPSPSDLPEGTEGLGQAGSGQGKKKLTLADLTPTADEIARAIGSAAPDHLPNVESDSETRLNAWRWVHAPFFDRIKSAVSRNWHIHSAYRQADPNGDVYGTLTMRTALSITIDRNGALKSLNIIDAAEGRFADDAALHAFRAAAPFLNPPPGLFGSSDTFTFRFDFVVDSSRNSGINFDWKPY